MQLSRQESEEKIRCFVAVPVPEDIKKQLAGLQEELSPKLKGAKWVKPAGLHVTLKFLGEISPAQVEKVCERLARALAAQPFNISFSGLGVFPKPARARVLWIGFSEGADRCRKIWESIEGPMEEAGFRREKRPFRAHLTLARFRNPGPVAPEILDHRFSSSGFRAESVVLYRSQLKPSGAVYTPIETYPLGDE